MRRILLILVLFLPTMVHAEKTMSYMIDVGKSFDRGSVGITDPNNTFLAFAVRRYFNPNFYLMGKLTAWNQADQQAKGDALITVSLGGRTSGRLFFDGSFGIGYLNNPDGRRVEYGYLTGHRQFEVNLGFGWKINKKMAILTGITHISNCNKYCSLSERYSPNRGRDFVRIGIERKF